jgi:hypothetical protein
MNPIAFGAYATLAICLCCILFAALRVPFPFRLRSDADEWVLLADTPDGLRAESVGNSFQRERLRDIFDKVKGCSEAEAKHRMQLYEDRWMRLSGVIAGVRSEGGHMQVMIRPGSRKPNVCMKFNDASTFRGLTTLAPGRRVTALGQIELIESCLVTTIASEIIQYF